MLEFSWPAFVFAIVNFLVLTGLLYKFLHKPILNVLAERRERIVQAQEQADKKAREAEETRKTYARKVDEIQTERDRMLSETRARSETRREEILEKAREEADREIENRKAAFERERREALEDLQNDMVDLSIDTAGRILKKAADADLETKLNQRLLEQLQALVDDADREVRPDADSPHVKITSASPLPDDVDKQFFQALEALGVQRDQVDVDTDESLVAGARVEFADRALDASLRDVLDALREKTREMRAAKQAEEVEADRPEETKA